jgi:hypothetical protein
MVKTVFRNMLGPSWPAKGVGSVGPTLGRLGPSLVPHHPFRSYCPWTPLVLDIIKICKDFGPYCAFLSSDIPVMVDQQKSWNSLVLSTYILYLEWNIGMLAINVCILWPPTPLKKISSWDLSKGTKRGEVQTYLDGRSSGKLDHRKSSHSHMASSSKWPFHWTL